MADERSANALDRRIGQRVRARRLEIEMSQERLSHLLGVTFQQVQKDEKGVNRVAASRLWDIAQALELPISSFFEGPGGQKGKLAPSELDDALATPDGARLLAMFSAVKDRKVRRRILDLVEAVVKE